MPTKVPLVPSVATQSVTRPSLSCQISGPVVWKCASQFASFPYWSAKK